MVLQNNVTPKIKMWSISSLGQKVGDEIPNLNRTGGFALVALDKKLVMKFLIYTGPADLCL